ncbi:tRNA(Ile)-lysidine synthase [Roseospirillum parvum]|uniref:tRNA(Ile)-lysidine synthase n=2 Tax=Roseospirillum parvum TaxID=83401 RepID=A0A1G7XNR3_9PROT|nr:tRNA(Ile)-lysidine synthase [Roseospirillum parvum]
MGRLGPFEPAPRLAVAVSGGADSLALTLLAEAWARARGGAVLALTVDHRLRPGSTDEAAWVAARLAERGIAHRTLTWEGGTWEGGTWEGETWEGGRGGLQERARAARLGLLEEACREAGILHLLLGHQTDDQAETVALRHAVADSPGDGAAGISALRELAACRLLRPLLAVPRAALAAWLAGQGLQGCDDPSNHDRRFARVRVRAARAAGATPPGTDPDAIAAAGRARVAAEAALASLAPAVAFHPAGFACLNPAPLDRADRDGRRRLLGRLLCAVGGREHPPPRAALDALAGALAGPAFRGRCLGRCRLARLGDGRVLVAREARHLPPPLALDGLAGPASWDGRWRVEGAVPGNLTLGALGEDRPAAARAALAAVPGPARPTLAALRAGGTVVAVVGLWRALDAPPLAVVTPSPMRRLFDAPFVLAGPLAHII